MSEQSIKEREHHDKIADSSGGTCWANSSPAGQLRQERRAKMGMDYIRFGQGDRILEIGCGNGEFSKRFIDTQAIIYCVDISSKLISVLKEKYRDTNLRFETRDVESLGYPEEYFDGIMGNGVLHHLNLDICLKEIYRVLKRGGRIFFTEPNMLNPEVFLETNVRFIGKIAQKTADEKAFFRLSLKRMLEKSGFKNVSVIPFDFLQPLTPAPLINIMTRIGCMLEHTPILKEIAGSLKIMAEK